MTFDPFLVSPNRVDNYLACGVAFKRRYIENRPAEWSSGAQLFGSAVHGALEKWSLDRTLNVRPLMIDSWRALVKDTPIEAFLREFHPLAGESERVCREIQRRRPEIKVPRMTKDYKKSPIAQQVERCFAKHLPAINASPDWRFSKSDPLPSLYSESLALAREYELRWNHLPVSFATEINFKVPFRSFILQGYIDSIEPVVNRETGEAIGRGILDYKTYGREWPLAKDRRQLVFYRIAHDHLVETGVIPPTDLPIYCILDRVRWVPQWEKPARIGICPDESDFDRLELELQLYEQGVRAGIFLPASKGYDSDWCDYPADCCMKKCSAREVEEVVFT